MAGQEPCLVQALQPQLLRRGHKRKFSDSSLVRLFKTTYAAEVNLPLVKFTEMRGSDRGGESTPVKFTEMRGSDCAGSAWKNRGQKGVTWIE